MHQAAATRTGLEIATSYNSPVLNDGLGTYRSRFGIGWLDPYDLSLSIYQEVSVSGGQQPSKVGVRRADGKEREFRAPASGNLWTADTDVTDRLERLVDGSGNTTGWKFIAAASEDTELYDVAGKLLSVTNRQGLAKSFTYSDGRGGLLYSASSGTGASPIGYIAPACTAPLGWVYQLIQTNPPVGLTGNIPSGRLLCVTNPFGRQVNFQYDALIRVIRLADEDGALYAFEYDGPSAIRWATGYADPGNLTKVSYPDGTSRTYYYNEQANVNGGATCANLPATGLQNHLTGIVDENGNRFANWKYDCQGQGTSTEHAGGVEKITLAYDAPAAGQTTITTYTGNPASPATTSRVFGYANINGVVKGTGITNPATSQPEPCASCGAVALHDYDVNGNEAGSQDWNGNKTCYAYDTARNLETRRVEGLPGAASCTSYATGTPSLTGIQRMISTTWSSDWRLPLSTAEPLRITSYTYGAPNAANPGDRGNILSKTIQATSDTTGALGFAATQTGTARTWTYTYDANGSVLTVNGPRTDVADITTYTYYANNDSDPGKRGNIATVTNALGQTTQFTAYNAYGQPLTIVDANGLATMLTYDARRRLVTRTVGNETTSYVYDGTGKLVQVTLPDASTLTHTYDAAHRLIAIQDNLGNKITYTLDLQGNHTKEDITDPVNTLVQTRSRVYSAINRLQQEIGAQNQITQYAYDLQGNLSTVTDPLNRVTTNAYDALNRLASMTQPAPAPSQPQPVISYGYNGLNQLTQVTDPRSLVTNYAYDGLDNMNQLVSPDTGTATRTYDAAGNILTSTDAKGQTTTYTYDALNRVASLTYNQATGAQLKTVAYTYDQGTNGIGRLTTVTETTADGTTVMQTTQYAYDQHGRLRSETRNLAGIAYVTGYNYDAYNGRLLSMSYPSGRTLSYSYDALGRISQISTTAQPGQGGQTQLLVFGVTYHPFGGVKSYTLGNNRTVTRAYDQDGRISSYTLGGTSISVGYDDASRITSLLDTINAANSNSYGYDGLDRLTSASVPSTSYGYSYDLTGNRLSRTSGSATELTTVSTTSNRISQVAGSTTRTFSYDNNGSTTGDGNNTYTYDARGRMASSLSGIGTTTYQVGVNGQRVRKTSSLGDTVYHYDAQGKLIAEATPAGVIKKEYLYLLDILVGVTAQQ